MIPPLLISIIGWLYFLSWSISFYSQVLLNYRLKNIQGMNLDFLALNTLGYICYTIYCTYGYFNPQASVETGRVNLNDLLFVYHALAITCVMIVQSWIYPKGKNGVSAKTLGIIIVIVAFSAVYTILVHGVELIRPEPYLSVISFMGYFKISINCMKCWPQMIWNFKRKSTKGWSTSANVLDLVGGAFAFLQVYLEFCNDRSMEVNKTKLLLAAVCMMYDTVFLVQRYCLYGNGENVVEYKEKEYVKQTERVFGVENAGEIGCL